MLIDAPEMVDFTLQQGNTWIVYLTLQNADQSPINLTGYKAMLTVAGKRRGQPSWGWRDQANYALITDPIAGQMYIGLLQGTTRQFGQLEELAYDASIQNASGRRTTVMTGTLRIRHEAARIVGINT